MSDVDNKVKMIVEGLLLSAGRPLTLDNIIAVFSDDEKPDRQELKAVMDAISEECGDRGFELKEVASGFRFQVKQELSEWVAKLWEERPPRYTRALLETLALIAYRQPITRGDIEEIRGVAVSSNIIRTLLDREWIRVVGHRDVPGRPAMFATTKQFLDYFNLKSLQELPPLAEIKELDSAEEDLDFADGMANQRVIDLPEESVDENSVELSEAEKAEMLAEEEAIELAKKPLDEILNLDPARNTEEQDSDADEEDADKNADDGAAEDQGGEQGGEQSDEQDDEPGEDEHDPQLVAAGEQVADETGDAVDAGASEEYVDESRSQSDSDAEYDVADDMDLEDESGPATDSSDDDLVAADEILSEDDSLAESESDYGERFAAPDAGNPDPDAEQLSESTPQQDADENVDDDEQAEEPASDPLTRSGSE